MFVRAISIDEGGVTVLIWTDVRSGNHREWDLRSIPSVGPDPEGDISRAVKVSQYPFMLVTAGLNDPRVSYWEPAKWVQRLRKRTRNPRVILKTEMGAGHQGPSGRYEIWRDEAFVYAFVLSALELA